MGRSSSTKAEWLGVLETAAKVSVEQSSAIWVWMMQELRLGPQYFLAIREAVQQGRWRTAKNPKTYIKTVAKREALKMGLVKEDSGNLVTVGSSGVTARKYRARKRWNTLGTTTRAAMLPKAKTQSGGPERQESGTPGDPLEEHDSYREWLASGMPRELAIVTPPSEEWKATVREMNDSFEGLDLEARPSVRPDWNKWAAAAGLDEWEMKVLRCRLAGVSREQAMAATCRTKSRGRRCRRPGNALIAMGWTGYGRRQK